MPYESKIRTYNADRVTRNTTISLNLQQKIKRIAKQNHIPFNQLLTEGIDYVLLTYKKPNDFTAPENPIDRVQMGTTYSNAQYQPLKERARKLKTSVNTLIELGIIYIIKKYEVN